MSTAPLSIFNSSVNLPVAKRRQTYAVLRALSNTQVSEDVIGGIAATETDNIIINFPMMPDTIELTRRAHYYNAVTSPVTPDGFHVYQSTDPLSIPISFSLNGFDEEFCLADAGPIMLLALAAKLHALALPIAASDATRWQALAAIPENSVAGGQTDAQLRQQPQGLAIGLGQHAVPNSSHFYFPPACALQVIFARLGSGAGQTRFSHGIQPLGINCVGFVSDVRVVFKGPWLQGSFGSDGARNLPSSADYSFTFVHQPGYTNYVLGSDFGAKPTVISTTALDVYRRLYNTIDMSHSVTYAGLSAAEIQGTMETAVRPVAVTPTGSG
jgi:hypothetical protein